MLIIVFARNAGRSVRKRILKAWCRSMGWSWDRLSGQELVLVPESTIDAIRTHSPEPLDPEPQGKARECKTHLSTICLTFSPCACQNLRRLDLVAWYTSGFQ